MIRHHHLPPRQGDVGDPHEDEVGIELEPLVEDPPSEDAQQPPPCPGVLSQAQQHEHQRQQGRGCGLPHAGLFMAVLSSLFFSLCSLIVKILSDVNPMELAVFRFIGIILPTVPLLIRRGDPPFPKGRRLLLILRGIVGATSLMLQFYAFRHMPLADASVIVFSVPVFVAVFAKFFLGEPCGLFHGGIILLTLAGVVFIARPPFIFGSLADVYTVENWWGCLAAISGTIVAANVYVILRILKGLHFSVIMTNFASVALIMTPLVSYVSGNLCVPLCGKERYLIVAIGAFSFGGQILLTKALQLEQAGPVAIARTADVVFAFIWQILFFHDIPDGLSFAGAILVTSGVLLTGIRKWLLSLPETSRARRVLRILTC